MASSIKSRQNHLALSWAGLQKKAWFGNLQFLVSALVGMALLVLFIFYTSPKPSTQQVADSALRATSPSAIELPKQANPSLPLRLRIPRIKVDAAIEHVELTSKGDMDEPSGPATVAWYKQGPRPGQIGNSVIAGHFGWIGGKPAAFDNLQSLRPGDKLYVEDKKGEVVTFVVRKTKTYNSDAEPAEVFAFDDATAHLNLVTCEGSWINNQQGYSSRLVVFADQE